MPDDRYDDAVEAVGFKERVSDFIEWVFATRIQAPERLAADPANIFIDDVSNRRPMIVALILALFLHIVLFAVYWPEISRELIFSDKVIRLNHLARPAGGGPPRPVTPPEPVKPKPRPREAKKFLPIPDPTPQDPDPIITDQTIDVIEVVDQMTLADLNVGDISGPPGRNSQGEGSGSGPNGGPGDGTGGDGIYRVGDLGVREPTLIKQTQPRYTDDAIQAKVQGNLLLQLIIRKDGSVDKFKVIKSLGYGLEEKAIEEIASNWVFRPGTRDGVPVDVLALVEVSFTLR